jgi:rubrerythrin
MLSKDIVGAIRFAILQEKKAQKMYLKMYKKSDDDLTKELLYSLYQQEVKHEYILSYFLKLESFKEAKKRVMSDSAFASEKMNSFNFENRFGILSFFDFKNLISYMKLAMNKEKSAADLYLVYYNRYKKNGASKDLLILLNELYNEEKAHELLLKSEYGRLIETI